MYSAHTIQVNDLIKKILEVIQEKNGHNIEIATNSEAALKM